jgi:iron complex outermembrane receptor protein
MHSVQKKITSNCKRVAASALLFFVSSIAFAQSQVTGTVKDVNGEPLIGVSVVEEGTTNGTVTDMEGKYTLNVKPGAKLKFSYIGFTTQEVKAGASKNIVLKENNKTLNEVVVVGYGTMRRKDVTSSITTIKSEDLNKGVFSDPAQMLQGKVPGLIVTSNGDPNGSPAISLRGASSLRGGEAMSPYYVIDGIPGVDISMVAPDDIESIDVLRDATATAIYGSKAANGVIIITTKKGAAGHTNVTYNGYVGFDRIAKTLDMMSASEMKAFASETGTAIDDNGGDVDWQKEVLRTGVSYNHNVSINGGNDKTKYMASVNYQKRNGIIKGSDMSRMNVRSLLSTKILKDHLDLSIGANLMYGKFEGVAMNSEGGSVMDAMNYFSPLNPVDFNGKDKNYNPLRMIDEDTSSNTWKRQQFVGKATLHIIKGLDLNANYSFGNHQRTSSSYDSRLSELTMGKNGQANRNTYLGDESTFEIYGNYSHTFNKLHSLSLMAGYSWEEKHHGDGFGLTVYNFFDDYVKYNNLTYASSIDGISGIQSGTKENIRNISFYGRLNYAFASKYMLQATVRRDGSSVFGKNHRWGTFPSVSVAWNITEENFMKNQNVLSNLKLRFGYGVSGNALGFGAYSAVARYGAIGFFDYTNADGTTTSYRTLGAMSNANPDLKWESTGMFNIGIDYAFLGGRVNGSVEFYNKKTWDLIWNYPVSTNIYPYGDIFANVGEITNRGVEFVVNADVIRNKNFRWNTTLNLSHNMNRVDKLSNDIYHTDRFTQGDPMVAGVSANGYTQRIMEGEPIGTFYTFEFAGFNEDGRATYYEHDANGNRTGKTTTSPDDTRDRVITGSAQPKLNLGWNNTLTWKNFSATFFFTGVFGNKIYDGTRASYMAATNLASASGTKNVLADFAKEQVVELANGKKVINTDPNIPSDRWIENGSYLRLQTFTLGYTFRDGFNKWINDATLYFTANNVFTITGYKGLDPEVNMGGTDPGIDYRWSVYPHTRTYMIGLKVNF